MFLSVLTFSLNAQILFSENFEGSMDTVTKIPLNWKKTGLSLDGIYEVGDSARANYILNQTSLWKVPSHTKFVMTNDIRCSYEKGIGFCNKSKDRLILPLLSLPTFTGSLILKFDTFFTGILGSQATVEVSLDGGSTWVSEYQIISDVNNWRSNTVNLTKYIGESNVLISFLYDDNNLVRDGLAIDNVVLRKQLPWKDVSLDYVDAAEYSRIPITQVDSIPLTLTFHNAGSLLLDTVSINVQVTEISNPQKILFKSVTFQKNINVGDTLNINVGKFLPVVKNTTYNIKHWVKTKNDTVIQNDSINIPIYISPSDYARDNGTSNAVFDLTSSNTITLGNIYNISMSSYLDSVYFETNNATIGTAIQAFVFPLSNGKVSLSEIGKSDVYTFSSQNVSSYLKIKSLLSGRVLLDTGNYLIAIQKTNGGGSMGIKLCDNYYQNNTVFMRIGSVSFQTLDSYFSGTKKTVPIIRANLTPYCKMSVLIDKINTKCSFSTGELRATPVDAKSPITYLWNTGSKDSVIKNLSVGKYTLKLIDYNNCEFDSLNISMDPYPKPIIRIDSLQDPLCYNTASGYLSITTDKPEIISKVSWNGIFTNQLFISNVKSGAYHVHVIDGNNCEDSLLVNLFNPDSISVNYIVKDETIKSKGMISLFVSGGNPPYSYNWGNAFLGNNRTDLKGDSSYVVIVKDTNGCQKSTSIFVGSILGIDEAMIDIIKIFPNPISDILNIESEKAISSLTIIDISGKICENLAYIPTYDKTLTLNLTNLENGAYFLSVNIEGEIKQFKFIKN